MNSTPQPVESASGAAIACENISRSFAGPGVVLDRISFQAKLGELVALLWPSGSGKSSLLRLVAGLDSADGGRLAIDAAGGALARGFVFQEPTLMPWRSVLRNTTLPLELAGWTRADAQTRALTTRPNLLLLDEPFAALDEPTRHGLQMQLREIWSALRMTVLFVTHSVTEAVFLADRIIVLSHRPGRIVADERIALAPVRFTDLRTSVEYLNEVRRIGAAMPAAEEAP